MPWKRRPRLSGKNIKKGPHCRRRLSVHHYAGSPPEHLPVPGCFLSVHWPPRAPLDAGAAEPATGAGREHRACYAAGRQRLHHFAGPAGMLLCGGGTGLPPGAPGKKVKMLYIPLLFFIYEPGSVPWLFPFYQGNGSPPYG